MRLTRGLVAGGIGTPKAVNPELEAQIRARLTDPGPYLVYADWLQQRGDPRGDLIAMHAQLAAAPGDTKLAKAVAAFLDANGSYLLPPALDDLLRAPKRAGDETFRCTATWRMGFLDRVRIARKKSTKLDVVALVADVLRHPSSVFLRALAFGPLGTPAETSYIEIIRELTKGTIPSTIEEIELGDFAPDVDLAFVRTGSLNPLLAAAPALRRLAVRAGTVRFESAVKHATLRELAIVASEITTPNLQRLFAAKLPELVSLDLTCAGLQLAVELRTLVTSKTLPNLRHLALRQVAEPELVRTVIERSPLGAQLASTAASWE